MIYFSAAWINAVHDAARADTTLRAMCTDADLVLQQIVTDEDGSVAQYAVVLNAEGPAIVEGAHPNPHVTFSQSRTTATAISQGELNALEAVQDGRVEIRGDAGRLERHRQVLAALHGVFDTVGS
jgi:hypothetical protein